MPRRPCEGAEAYDEIKPRFYRQLLKNSIPFEVEFFLYLFVPTMSNRSTKTSTGCFLLQRKAVSQPKGRDRRDDGLDRVEQGLDL